MGPWALDRVVVDLIAFTVLRLDHFEHEGLLLYHNNPKPGRPFRAVGTTYKAAWPHDLTLIQ